LDRQYKALKRLYSNLKNDELFFKLVLVNALLSYQLPTKGERYWENFADFFSQGKKLKDFEEFLKIYNNRFLSAKIKRFRKVLPLIDRLSKKELIEFCQSPEKLLDYLAKGLNQPPSAKTLVFAVKMFIYACRIATERRIKAPFDIDIPLDVRLKRISKDLQFWRELAKKLEIPPLHLDAVIWTTMGADKEFIQSIPEDLRKKVLNLKKTLQSLISR